MTLVLDAGGFVAVERNERTLLALLKRRMLAGEVPRTHGGVVGQVWRGGAGRQAPLARLLAGVEIESLDGELGRRSGALLGRSGTTDVIDAAVVLLAADGDDVVTSDPDDLTTLAAAAGVHVELIPI